MGASPQEQLELVAQHQRLLDSQRLLFEVSARLGPALELDGVLQIALEAMRELVGHVRGGTIVLCEGDQLRVATAAPSVDDHEMQLRLHVEKGLSARVLRSRRPYRTGDLRDDPHVDDVVGSAGADPAVVSWLGVPLVALGQVIGLLQVDSTERDAFDEVDELVLAGFGTLVAGAIESARRYEAVLELERLKSDFLERVSHELRTPIAIMQGFATTLTRVGGTMTDDVRDGILERIAAASDRLAYLVEEVLTVTSMDGGIARPVPEVVDLRAAVTLAQRGLPEDHRIRVDVPAGLTIVCDPTLLRQALSPLLDNAVKYGLDPRVEAEVDGDRVVVRVRDSGPGVDPRVEPRIFDRFVRGRHTVEGMGLGLSISRHLAAAMDATVEQVRVDEGACFELRLPLGP